MDDIIPVEDIMRSIDELGKMDLKIQDVNKQAKINSSRNSIVESSYYFTSKTI